MSDIASVEIGKKPVIYPQLKNINTLPSIFSMPSTLDWDIITHEDRLWSDIQKASDNFVRNIRKEFPMLPHHSIFSLTLFMDHFELITKHYQIRNLLRNTRRNQKRVFRQILLIILFMLPKKKQIKNTFKTYMTLLLCCKTRKNPKKSLWKWEIESRHI